MSENYKIIKDEESLKRFVDWLPECEDNETYYYALYARSKYFRGHPALKADKSQLQRGSSPKERLLGKIRRLECPLGAYTGAEGIPIPQEALALYICPNPRDSRKAAFQTIRELSKQLEENKLDINARQVALNQLQVSKRKNRYLIFDLDSRKQEDLDKVKSITKGFEILLETRGGYHILVSTEIAHNLEKNWFVQLKNIEAIDVVDGNMMIPVPGCVQGDWVPRFI